MPNYRDMYFHMAGRTATTIEVLESTAGIMDSVTGSLQAVSKEILELAGRLKLAQQRTEEMFINSTDEPT